MRDATGSERLCAAGRVSAVSASATAIGRGSARSSVNSASSVVGPPTGNFRNSRKRYRHFPNETAATRRTLDQRRSGRNTINGIVSDTSRYVKYYSGHIVGSWPNFCAPCCAETRHRRASPGLSDRRVGYPEQARSIEAVNLTVGGLPLSQ